MKLLIISNNPLRPSFRQRIGMFLGLLPEDGIETEVHKLPKPYIQRWSLFRRSADFDAVLLHKKCLNLLDARCLRSIRKFTDYPYEVLVIDNDSQDDSLRYLKSLRNFPYTTRP